MTTPTTLFVWDSDYYLAYQQEAQPDPMGKAGDILMPPNCTKVAPECKAGYFYKWDPAAQKWVEEAKPTSAADFVGKQISHKSQTLHYQELRLLLQKFVAEDPEHYRVIRGTEEEGLWWSIEKIPEKTVDELRVQKMSQLDSAFMSWYEDKATVTTSLGFVADSDARAMMDVSGLVTTLEAQPVESRATVAFMDANNEPHLLSLEQLKTVQVEIIQNGQSAYQQKWALRTAIESAQTKEELDAIEIKFTAEDFSK